MKSPDTNPSALFEACKEFGIKSYNISRTNSLYDSSPYCFSADVEINLTMTQDAYAKMIEFIMNTINKQQSDESEIDLKYKIKHR